MFKIKTKKKNKRNENTHVTCVRRTCSKVLKASDPNDFEILWVDYLAMSMGINEACSTWISTVARNYTHPCAGAWSDVVLFHRWFASSFTPDLDTTILSLATIDNETEKKKKRKQLALKYNNYRIKYLQIVQLQPAELCHEPIHKWMNQHTYMQLQYSNNIRGSCTTRVGICRSRSHIN